METGEGRYMFTSGRMIFVEDRSEGIMANVICQHRRCRYSGTYRIKDSDETVECRKCNRDTAIERNGV